jgi:hypothetical protein
MRRIRLHPSQVVPLEKARPGLVLKPSPSNPRVKRWQKADGEQAKPAPSQRGRKKGPEPRSKSKQWYEAARKSAMLEGAVEYAYERQIRATNEKDRLTAFRSMLRNMRSVLNTSPMDGYPAHHKRMEKWFEGAAGMLIRANAYGQKGGWPERPRPPEPGEDGHKLYLDLRARRDHHREARLKGRRKMRKGRAVVDVRRFMEGKPRAMRKGWDPSSKPVEWVEDGVVFTFRKATTGVGVLTARWPGAAMPYHIVAPDLDTARRDALDVVNSLRKGATPSRGVFRREDAPSPRRRRSTG